ncbi:MAG: permease component of ABC-type sugar transporter [Chloroflexi bacterium]|nr:permease component of ABC-type sugar transporter [Chloroflexota bacterium]
MTPATGIAAASTNTTDDRPIKRGHRKRRESTAAALFLLPSTVLFVLFVLSPIIASFVLTFFRWDGLSSGTFIGLDNYRTLFHDSLVRTVLTNTVVFVVGDTFVKMVLALLLAVVVHRYLGRFLRTLFRGVIFFPVIVSGVAVGIIWQWLMNTSLGLINYYAGALGLPTTAWLDSSSTALSSLIIVDVWRNIGFSFVVFTAGLQGISSSLYEAAAVDGAGEWSQFWSVTLPLLSPTTYFLLVINLIGAFQFFDLSFVMTQGGPGDATRTIVYYIYDTGFHFFRFGYASTLSVLLFAILAVLTLIQVRMSRRWVFYQ